MTISEPTDDHLAMCVAIWKATEFLELARAELISAEAFAKLSLSGSLRDNVLDSLRLSYAATLRADTRARWARRTASTA